MPQLGRYDGDSTAAVSVSPGAAGTVNITVAGQLNSHFRIGVTSPSGNRTFGEFETDGTGKSALTLTPWTDPGTWLITVDFGGGHARAFAAAYRPFQQ